jgi:hypothetical protein
MAAETVLRGALRPLTSKEISEMAIEKGLIQTEGKTPRATMRAALYAATKANPKGPIRREFTPGPTRAARYSVRWYWNGR